MFRCRVEIGDAADAAERFEQAYRRAVVDMKVLLDGKAAEERGSDSYRDRTGNLRAGTRASDVISEGDTDTVELRADAPYAVYVNRRGYMRIDDLAAEAAKELEYLFEGLALSI
jgi:hypothetical protein